MKKKFNLLLIIFILINQISHANTNQIFFTQAKEKFENNEIEDSKFLFQRDIVFNPKNAKSYLYLAKIYNYEKDEKKEIKNLNTTLLLDPNNEEAIYLMINIEIKKSNFNEVKKLMKNFSLICKNFCDKIDSIEENLKNIEPKNET